MAKKRSYKKRTPRAVTHTTRKRKSVRRRKRGMSEMFNATTAMAAGRTIGAAAIGGALAGAVNKMLVGQPTYQRIGTGVVASFLTYAVGGFPHMAAGMAGGFAAIETQPLLAGLMSEDGDYFDYANSSSLNEMPVYLNEAGEAVYLNEDGQVTLAEDVYLNEGIYPDYATQY